MSARLDSLRQWACARHGLPETALSLTLAAGDASFRRYYRLTLPDATTRMLMDAPPEQENSRPFVAIANAWRDADLPVPQLHGIDLEQGFLELDDLGDTPLQRCFTDDSAIAEGYDRALTLLARLQAQAPVAGLPAYDAALLGRELDLFPEWCLERLLGIATPPEWQAIRERLIDTALAQPRVAVHRDYDAMNLMVAADGLYLIDFQDAVAGPLSYDLISLLRGRYWRFDEASFAARVEAFRQGAIATGRLSADVDTRRFRLLTDAMAAQRCLKVLGIFCRLTLRDGKLGYLERLPHFLAHLDDSLAPHNEFAPFRHWLGDTFTPALHARLQAQETSEPQLS
ncbi:MULTISPECIES: aminoglycoside phosphotransferase family protein [Halomonadaceae]|uniref:aminoglycoside phosphotransferase family protein n=1 Tax=Halomonadaceae TaxID=28256 RepID=UPI00159AA72C|nr:MULTISPECIES: phosphotransferase [Halomonas]QJQ94778.1 phosphotransferase [Halomonas sp. PA5]